MLSESFQACMPSRRQRTICTVCLFVTLAIVVSGCGAGSGSISTQPVSPSPSAPVTPALTVIPGSPAVRVNGSVRFSANAQVSWTVQEGATGGTISSGGAYTAPQVPGLYHVTATAVADNSKIATVNVVVTLSGFSRTSNLASARIADTATLLADGHVVVVGGGEGPDLVDGFFVVSGAELFDPTSTSFASIGTSARDFHTAPLLPSGQVLLAEEKTIPCSTCNTTATAEVYDPSTGRFQPTGAMSVERESHTATLLKDGKVLIVGGIRTSDGGSHWETLQTAEIYDPSSGAFSATGSLNQARVFHAATLLADGRVLITGGSGNNSAELYDPGTGSFKSAGAMTTERHWHTATLLPDGKVLVAGGLDDATAEVYDPVTSSFKPTGTMLVARSLHSATLLPDGNVLIVGGDRFGNIPTGGATATAEIYDPLNGSFTRTGDLAQARFWHAATLLLDGSVLLVGGADSSDGIRTTPLNSAEIYK